MTNLTVAAKNQVQKMIPKNILELYQIDIDEEVNSDLLNGCLQVQSPSYINVDIDDKFKIEQSEHCFYIKNKKVNVSIWKEIKKLHVTVY